MKASMSSTFHRIGSISLLLILFSIIASSSISLVPTLAQSTEPINISELTTGSLSPTTPRLSYSLVTRAGDILDVEIRRVTGDIVPQFTVLRGTQSIGIWYAYAHGSVGDDLAGGQIHFDENGEYTIQVTSRDAANTAGTFVLLVSPTVPPTPLAVGQNLQADVVGGETKVFVFKSIVESPLLASVELQSDAPGLVVRLKNTRNDVLGSFQSPIQQGQFNIAQGQKDYVLEVLNGSTVGTIQFTVNLTSLTTASPGVEIGPNGLPIMPNSGDCIVATRSSAPVNIRPEPSQNKPAFSVISPTKVYTVTARNADNTWYQIQDDNQRTGWVAAIVTRLGGNCESLPVQ